MNPDKFIDLCRSGTATQVREALYVGADSPEWIDVNAKGRHGKTPLIAAAEENSPEVVNLLLRAGANVNAKDDESETALIKAAETGRSLEVVDVLIRSGADVNATRGGTTPLIEAATNGDSQIVKRLIEAGADVNARNGWGATALMMATQTPEIIEILLQAGAEANLEHEDSYTVLMMQGLNPESVKLLLQAGADVNAINDDGGTVFSWVDNPEVMSLLCQAEEDAKPLAQSELQTCRDFLALCEDGTAAQVREAIAAGADVNVRDEAKTTPLIAAVKGDSLEIVEVLIQAGANVNARGKYDVTALTEAATKCNPDIVKALLKAGANINASDCCANTALMCAAGATEPVGDKEEVVKILLQAGADPNARSTSVLWTPLMVAADMGALQILDILLNAGAEIDARDVIHRTALMVADTPEVLNALLDAGADATLMDSSGNRALDYARNNEKLIGTEALRRLETASGLGP